MLIFLFLLKDISFSICSLCKFLSFSIHKNTYFTMDYALFWYINVRLLKNKNPAGVFFLQYIRIIVMIYVYWVGGLDALIGGEVAVFVGVNCGPLYLRVASSIGLVRM